MKTVMKKIFSLMLVAVLLVSAVPFVASAAEETKSWDLTLTAGETYSVDEICKQYYSGSSTNYWVQNGNVRGESFVAREDLTYTLYVVETVADPAPVDPCAGGHTPGAAATCTTAQTCTVCGKELAPKAAHTPGAAATCTTAQTCTVCGEVLAAAAHTPGAAATCQAPQTCTVCGVQLAATAAHTYENGKCSVCGICQTCGKQCDDTVQITFQDALNGTTSASYPVGTTVDLATPDWVSGWEFEGWKLNGTYITSYQIPACGEANVTIVADWDQTTVTPTYPVKVYARLHTGDLVTDVVEIHHNDTMLSGDKVLSYLTHEDTQATLWNIINSKYSDYSWSGNFYNAYGERAATNNITTVNGSKSVYINLHSDADRVLLYVHMDSMTRTYQYLYEMDGYKVGGPAIRTSEVRDFLQNKLGVNFTMKMFDEKGFEDYLDGKSNTQTNYVTVTGNPTEVHVRLYVTGSSSSAQADSTNPKTGDMIMTPAIIMCASIGALATLFYLNKKRAI